jgi:hypothetical protein
MDIEGWVYQGSLHSFRATFTLEVSLLVLQNMLLAQTSLKACGLIRLLLPF